MSFEVIVTRPFERKFKKLAKKHLSLKSDLLPIIAELTESPKMGKFLGKGCFKIRMAITSKGLGKSGGARLITLVRIQNETVFLLDIYDKSKQATIPESELKMLIDIFAD